MSFFQLNLILRARWRSALVAFLVCLGLVAAFTWMKRKTYVATAAVVLDVKSPDPIAGVVLPGMTVSGYMGTQVDVLQSERVILRAVQSLGLDKNEETRAAWREQTDGQGDFAAWLAGGVAAKLDARPGKDSNVIQVSFTSTNAKAAADMANAIVKAYIETTVELRTEPARQYNALFVESTQTLRAALEAALARLSEFQQAKGVIATDERLDVENNRLAELSTQLVALQGATSETTGRQLQAGRQAEQMQEVLNNPMVSTLGADLARQEAKLNELRQRYGDQHPQLIELRANINELRGRIDVQKQRITGSLTVNDAVNQGRLQTLRESLEAQRIKVLQMKSLRDEAAILQRDVENARRVYDAGFSKLSQSTLESQATQTNVSIVRTATPPPFPSSPRVGLNLAIGALLGLALGLAMAVLREHRDWRLRAESDVIDVLKQPLLGVMPDAPRGPVAGHPRSLQGVAMRVLGRPAVSS